MKQIAFTWFLLVLGFQFLYAQQMYDLILRHGTIYDGSGGDPYVADLAVNRDTIAFIGDLSRARGKQEVDVNGLAVAPGFINMLSWADGTLLQDGAAMSDILQGVTLEVFGEGISAGPRRPSGSQQRWTTLGGYFDYLEKKGVSPNFASFLGATTIRSYVVGLNNRQPNEKEWREMRALVKQAMEEGALGIGSSLIYAPATFATTDELIELCKVAGNYGGRYITHMRSESDGILQALNETFRIAMEARVPAEIYHLKITQRRNWPKIDTVLQKIDSARKSGLRITANMYPYEASATGLKERVPIWAQEGGAVQLKARIRNSETRRKILYDMANGIPTRNSDPKDVMLLGFRKDSLNRLYKGRRLDEIARMHGKDADETVLDLLSVDGTAIGAVYFVISRANMYRMLAQPYVSIGSDAGALALTRNFTASATHPRAYGTFARVLGPCVRDEKLFSLQEAVRKMTSLPAANLGLRHRGSIKQAFVADLAIFDPAKIQDHATYSQPHQYATGIRYVFVNGIMVVKEGIHTGAKPGRCVRGPGFKEK